VKIYGARTVIVLVEVERVVKLFAGGVEHDHPSTGIVAVTVKEYPQHSKI
jgi:hypothetical protein